MTYFDQVPLLTKAYPHQQEKFDYYYQTLRDKWKVMLEHEMGLGKTRTSIHLSLTLAKEGVIDRMFVVAPKPITSTWVDQLKLHAGVSTGVFRWSANKPKTEKGRKAFYAMLTSPFPIFIVNIEAFQTENPALLDWCKQFLMKGKAVTILDESVKIKDAGASRTRRLKGVVSLCTHRIALTGIMAPEAPLNVFSQFEFLDPFFWNKKSYFMFKQRFAILKDTYVAGGRVVKTIAGYQNVDELMKRIEPFTWRLQKDKCIDLPEKIHIPMKVELSKEEVDAYETMRDELVLELKSGTVVTAPAKIALFSKFRQITGGYGTTTEALLDTPSKLRALLDDLEDTDEPAIIWCEYRHEILRIKKELEKIAPTGIFSGVQGDKENERDKKDFEEGRLRFFISDTGKGARGLNLQRFCSLQYYYSLTTSTDEFLQAQDRTHRMGQTKTCFYKYLLGVLPGVDEGENASVDTRIYDLVTRKESLARAFSDGTLADVISLL